MEGEDGHNARGDCELDYQDPVHPADEVSADGLVSESCREAVRSSLVVLLESSIHVPVDRALLLLLWERLGVTLLRIALGRVASILGRVAGALRRVAGALWRVAGVLRINGLLRVTLLRISRLLSVSLLRVGRRLNKPWRSQI